MDTRRNALEGRLATAAEVRKYLGVDAGVMARMRKAGALPRPVPGTRRYDIEAIKASLDQADQNEGTIIAEEAEALREARRWETSK